MGGRPADHLVSRPTVLIRSPAPDANTRVAARANDPVSWPSPLLLHGIAALFATAALTAAAPLVAVVLPILVLVGEAGGRRPLTLLSLIVSVLYVGHAPLGVPMPALIAAGAAVGVLLRVSVTGFTAWVHRAVLPAVLLGMVLADLVVRPAVTLPGRYAVFEQVVLLVCLIALLVDGRIRDRDDPDDADRTVHVALVWVSLIAGADSLRALSVADAGVLAARQAAGLFGASNYIAALLAVATVACVHRACTGDGRPWLNVVGAVVFVGLAAPHASRTSTIVFVVVVLWLLVVHRHHLWLLVAVAGFGTLLALVPTVGVIARFQAGDLTGDELNGRTELWAIAMEAIRQQPFLGVGAGGVSDDLIAAGFVYTTYVHDVWLSLVAQFGLVGLLFLVVGTTWIVRAPIGPYPRTLALTCLLLSTTEPVVETMKMGLIFVAVIGAGAARSRGDVLLTGRKRAVQ